MQSRKYIFCGHSVELQSDEPIQPEVEFSKFLSDYEKADYSIRLIHTDSLPPKDGELVFSSERRKIYNDGNLKTYTTYFNSKLHRYVDFACKVNNSELYISFPDKFRETTIFESLDLPAMLLEHNIGIIHCSFVEDDGQAILFVGDKQVGKSTQAALWKKYRNAETINGDRAAVYSENGIFYADGIPFCGTSKICVNKKLPIKALVCLSIGSCNEIKRLSSMEAFMKIVGKFTYNSTKRSIELISSLAGNMAEKLPIYAYSCLKDESAVTFLKEELG
jgi:hypothetical protein